MTIFKASERLDELVSNIVSSVATQKMQQASFSNRVTAVDRDKTVIFHVKFLSHHFGKVLKMSKVELGCLEAEATTSSTPPFLSVSSSLAPCRAEYLQVV